MWIPELRQVPNRFIHCPWAMSAEEQKRSRWFCFCQAGSARVVCDDQGKQGGAGTRRACGRYEEARSRVGAVRRRQNILLQEADSIRKGRRQAIFFFVLAASRSE